MPAQAKAVGRQAPTRLRPRRSGPASLHVLCAESKDETLPNIVTVGGQAQRRAARVLERANTTVRDGTVDLVARVLALIGNPRLLHGAVTVHRDPDVGDEVGLFLRAERRVETGPQLLADEVDVACRELAAERRLGLRGGWRGGRHAVWRGRRLIGLGHL